MGTKLIILKKNGIYESRQLMTLIFGYLHGWSNYKSCRLANACGAFVRKYQFLLTPMVDIKF